MKSPPPLDPGRVEAVLVRAFAERLREESARWGSRIGAPCLEDLALRILSGAEGGLIQRTGRASEKGGRPSHPSLGDIFEPKDYLHLVPQEIRKELGQYTTPLPIARHILRAAGYWQEEEILERNLCDPSCGSGVFLGEAVRIHLAALQSASVPSEQWYDRVTGRFLGIDIDPTACLYARFNLGMLLAPAILSRLEAHPRRKLPALPVRLGDTLALLASEMSGERGRAPLLGRFDFIVGNPPYKKLGRDSLFYREAFQDSVYGHANAYGLFLHAGIEMLVPQGALGFIVPRSMLSGLYFQNLRRLIEERARLEELTLLAERKRIFDEVLQGTMIVILRRRPDETECSEVDRPSIRTGIVRQLKDLTEGAPSHVVAGVRQVVRRLNGTTVWFVSDREKTYSILDKIIAGWPLLGSSKIACPAKTGPIVWNRVKPALRWQNENGTLPLLWATDIRRFRLSFGTVSGVRPAYLQETPQTRNLATAGPSLLIQRVTADEQERRIVAGLAAYPPRSRYFVENHLNVLQPAAVRGAVGLHYLLGVLSSDIVEFLFRSMNGNTQVSATELNLLPIPRGRFEEEIAALVEELEENERSAGRSDLEAEMNERVGRAYGLKSADLKFLQQALRERGSLRGPVRGA